MPFGLKNAGATFQRLMDKIMEGLDFVFVYLDDILISSVDKEEHHHHLQEVFNRLHNAGKSEFYKENLVFSASTSPRQACGPTTSTLKPSAHTQHRGTKMISPVLPA